MMRRLLLVITCVAALIGTIPAIAANPHDGSTGQPNQSCEDQPSGPPGFNSPGFEIAESHYAGEGPGSTLHANSDNAVSQYDVACFQLSSH
jgi:hypothetical protein